MKNYDPDILPFIARINEMFAPMPPHLMKPEAFRELVDGMSTSSRPPLPEGIEVRSVKIPTRFGEMQAKLYIPKFNETRSCLVYMHGGGWTVGSVDTHEPICSHIALKTPCLVLSLNYSLSPEYPFPRPLFEVLDACNWVLANANSINVDTEHLSIGGDSCGGNLATAACLYLRDHGAPSNLFRCQILAYPILDTNFETNSYQDNVDTPFLYSELCKWFWGNYLMRQEDWHNPYAIPMKAKSLVGLPQAYISVAEHDPLHDEGIRYADRLREAGVKVELRRVMGQIHGFLRLRSVSHAAENEFDAMCAYLAKNG